MILCCMTAQKVDGISRKCSPTVFPESLIRYMMIIGGCYTSKWPRSQVPLVLRSRAAMPRRLLRTSCLLTNSSSGLQRTENAIYVSYLENVFLGRDDERYRSARAALSDRLKAALTDLEQHWMNTAERGRERGPDF